VTIVYSCIVHIAEAVRPDLPVPHLAITGSQPIPVGVDTRFTAHADAVRLADALYASLPGATIDQLLAELMIRGAARLRVRMPQANLPSELVDDLW
jgi:hypothetical protein